MEDNYFAIIFYNVYSKTDHVNNEAVSELPEVKAKEQTRADNVASSLKDISGNNLTIIYIFILYFPLK